MFLSQKCCGFVTIAVVLSLVGACGSRRQEAVSVEEGIEQVVPAKIAPAVVVEKTYGVERRKDLRNSQRRISQLPIPESNAGAQEIEAARRVLANELLNRLEVLISQPDARGTRTRLQDIVDRLSLLQKAEGMSGETALRSQHGLIPSSETDRVEALSKLWRERGSFGSVADQVFREHGLMTCEHVPEMLRQWLSVDPPAQP